MITFSKHNQMDCFLLQCGKVSSIGHGARNYSCHHKHKMKMKKNASLKCICVSVPSPQICHIHLIYHSKCLFFFYTAITIIMITKIPYFRIEVDSTNKLWNFLIVPQRYSRCTIHYDQVALACTDAHNIVPDVLPYFPSCSDHTATHVNTRFQFDI